MAFLDLLGFSERIQETEIIPLPPFVSLIANLLETFMGKIESPVHGDKGDPPLITHFSDCLVLSFNPQYDGEVLRHLYGIRSLIHDLITHHHMVLRGAVTYGLIYHHRSDVGDILFGPAVIDAYHKERTLAKFPRIIVDRKVIDLGIQHRANGRSEDGARSDFESCLSTDIDEQLYIDFTSKNIVEIWGGDPNTTDPVGLEIDSILFNYYNDVLLAANSMLQSNDSRVVEKGHWLIGKLPQQYKALTYPPLP